MDYNEKYSYEPYTGGAGPCENQVKVLTALLCTAVHNAGADARLVEGTDDLGDKEVSVHCNGAVVIYDRWGYTSEDGELDNEDLNAAVEFILNYKD